MMGTNAPGSRRNRADFRRGLEIGPSPGLDWGVGVELSGGTYGGNRLKPLLLEVCQPLHWLLLDRTRSRLPNEVGF